MKVLAVIAAVIVIVLGAKALSGRNQSASS